MALQTLSLSASASRPDRCFDAYHELYSVGSDVVRTADRFSASVRAYRLDRALAFERRLDGVSHSRDAARIRRDGFDHLALHLLLSGDLIAGPTGAERHVKPGEIVVFDSSLPQRSYSHDTHMMSVSLARDQIGGQIRDLRPFHGHILSRREGGMIADLLLSFARRHETLPAPMANQFAPVLAILLTAAFQGTPAFGPATLEPQPSDRGRRRKAETFIEAHLGDHDLDVARIAAGIGVSRTLLYQAFAEEGGVARFIQQRRLDRIRNVLRRRGDGYRLATLAHEFGFSSEQHLNRAFRQAFGQPPGQFRSAFEQQRRTRPSGDGRAGALRDWLVELF